MASTRSGCEGRDRAGPLAEGTSIPAARVPATGGSSTMTVVITGAEGKLGTELLAAFSHRTVFAYSHAELDITSEEAVWHAVTSHAPSLVVNAAALTDATACEGDRDGAHRINALGPWWLARACAAGGATLIHVSAEHVLGGAAPLDGNGAPRGWTEFDPTSPIGEYGRS